jgi:large subunit ribosomal protein L13
MERQVIVDAEGAILGRLASLIAKRLLLGEKIIVINAEKAVLSGSPERVFERFQAKRERGSALKGPFYPKRPDMVLRRVVRGMLPRKKAKGREAYRRLKVYIGNPKNYQGEKLAKTKDSLACKYVTLAEVCRKLGWKG